MIKLAKMGSMIMKRIFRESIDLLKLGWKICDEVTDQNNYDHSFLTYKAIINKL